MAHFQSKIGEYAVIINSKKEFLMLTFDGSDGRWHLPGGRLEDTDESVSGLQREVKEETNLEIQNIHPMLTRIWSDERKYSVFFKANAVEPYELKISDEIIEYSWFRKEDIDSIEYFQPFYKQLIIDCFK